MDPLGDNGRTRSMLGLLYLITSTPWEWSAFFPPKRRWEINFSPRFLTVPDAMARGFVHNALAERQA